MDMKITLKTCFAWGWMFLIFCCSGDELAEGVKAINDGHLRKARSLFEQIAEKRTLPPQDRAVAYKHLGTVLFRLGAPNYLAAFDSAERIFSEEIKGSCTADLRAQYGYMLYQDTSHPYYWAAFTLFGDFR